MSIPDFCQFSLVTLVSKGYLRAMDQTNLFGDQASYTAESIPENAPLAYRYRPQSLEDFQGYQRLIQLYPFLERERPQHLIFWGPPGCGKTTLIHLLGKKYNQSVHQLNAVLHGIPDLKKTLNIIQPKESLFIDEIHRFNKTQQDALLPSVEKGAFTFYGATTENPFVSIIPALRSRVTIIKLPALDSDQAFGALKRITELENQKLNDKTLGFLSRQAGGDMRLAINLLEIAFEIGNDLEKLRETFRELNIHTAEYKERYYDLISALIKSMRGSDPQAAILYLAALIEEGHDLIAVARRLVIFASEDVGNADPSALSLASEALMSFQNVGMPEGRIILGQAVSYLASTLKSNKSYMAINHALEYVREQGLIKVPEILKNKKNTDYQYPHSFSGHFVKQQYTIDSIPKFYEPSEFGREGQLKSRLETLWKD